MPEADAAGDYHSAERSITAPWFILRKETLTSPGDSLVFAVLWSTLSLGATSRELLPDRKRRRVKIANAEIAARSGIRGGARAVKYHLQKLERLNYIKRYGNHRNREIEILTFPFLPEDRRGLTINQDILDANLSPTQKLLTAIYGAFPRANHHFTYDRLGLSRWLYYTNIKSIRLSHELDKKSNTTPPYITPELDKKSNYKGNTSTSTNKTVLPKGNIRKRACVSHSMEADMGRVEKYPNTLWHTPTSVRKAIKADKTKISQDILQELQEQVFIHKHITTHQQKSALIKAAKVVEALRHPEGLSKILEEETIEQIVKYHISQNRLDPGLIRQTLHRQFSLEERIVLYKRLSDSMSPDFITPGPPNNRRGQGKTVSLHHATVPDARHTEGFCRLLLAWLRPPVYAPVKPQTNISPETESLFVLIRQYIPSTVADKANLTLLQDLGQHYQRQIKPLAEQYEYSEGYKFNRWLEGLLRFAYNKIGNRLHLGWLKLGNQLFQEWETDFEAEMRESYNSKFRAKSLHKAFSEREAEERERAFQEAYGL